MLFSLTFLLVGCGSKPRPDVAVGTTAQAVALPKTPLAVSDKKDELLPKKIATAPPKIKTLAEATAKVFLIDGVTGSGFFISADGLFLTNEHIIPRGRCTVNGCAGIKIVRNFSTAGPTQTFKHFRILAQSTHTGWYDFTLLQVKLAPGQTVPFLKIDLGEKFNSSAYFVLGHPLGASLHATQVKSVHQDGTGNISFKGLVLGGNSGGPLIAADSGKVVGLVKSTLTEIIKEDANSATLETENYATPIFSILTILQKYLPQNVLKNHQLVSTSLSSLTGEQLRMTGADWIPNAILSSPNREIFRGALFRSTDDNGLDTLSENLSLYLDTDHETEVLNLMLQRSLSDCTPLNLSVLRALLNFSLQLGRPLKFLSQDQKTIEAAIATDLSPSDQQTIQIELNYFDQAERKELQKQCLSQQKNANLTLTISACLTTQANDGHSLLLDALDALKNNDFADATNASQFITLLMSLKAGFMTGNDLILERGEVAKTAELLYDQQKSVRQVLSSDAAATDLLQSAVEIGSFKETFNTTRN